MGKISVVTSIKRQPGSVVRLLAALVIGLTGLLAVRNSSAATFASAGEAETGAIAGLAQTISDTSASNGRSVQFGASAGLPYTPPAGFPIVNSNGTYTSTLGAPASAMRWLTSSSLIFNQPLPATTPLDAHSAEKVSLMATWAHIDPATLGVKPNMPANFWPATFEDSGNAPYIYLVDSSREHFQKIDVSTDNTISEGCPASGTAAEFDTYINGNYPGKVGIPLPAGITMSSDDSDYAVTVYDYKQDILFDFWEFKTPNLTGSANPSACWGGVIKNFSRSSGVFDYPHSGTMTGTSSLGLTITMDDFKRGVINHAIGISLFNTIGGDWSCGVVVCASSYSLPANRTGGNHWPCNSTDGYIPDPTRVTFNQCFYGGQRVRLPGNYDTSSITSPYAKMVAEALKKYGAVVQDIGGCAYCLQAESGYPVSQLGKGNPWTGALDAYSPYGDWNQRVTDQIPWEAMQVLPKDWQP